jgi:hypothetical protein
MYTTVDETFGSNQRITMETAELITMKEDEIEQKIKSENDTGKCCSLLVCYCTKKNHTVTMTEDGKL